jgi:uncharacterized protein (DUF1330 family)
VVEHRIEDATLSADYSQAQEILNDKARIVRLPFGPQGYIRKELLWDYLDELVDQCVEYLRSRPAMPDLIHSHYADAGYVGTHLSRLLGIPLVHTGHSLGRPKRARLLAAGNDPAELERQFKFERRIAAEEETLTHADLVYSSSKYLDVLPQRASKGNALTYLAFKWGIPLERFLVAGDSGNDLDMFRPTSLNVVVANHTPGMEVLRGRPHVYFAKEPHAGGILEGMRHYSFSSLGETVAGASPTGAAPSVCTGGETSYPK